MIYSTEENINILFDQISALTEIQSIGISGGQAPLPQVGEGDIDVFIYCDTIPTIERRQAILGQMEERIQESKVNVFEGGHWGTGDFLLVNGIETWLMYFTVDETVTDLEAILKGEFPDKLENYYYPIGRCGMLRNIRVMYDRDSFLQDLKSRLAEYPDSLSRVLSVYHLNGLEDTEDLERAVMRKDVLFYHFALDLALDHFLQALFALNKTYFPSRKRSLDYIEGFLIRPEQCSQKLLEVIKLGGCPDEMEKSYLLWRNMVEELDEMVHK